MSGILYIVGTPIGNLGDFSSRAIDTLSDVDFIAAEDTRVSRKLLNHFGISTPLLSYHQHNIKEQSARIIERLLNGENAAIISDAGMPVISDPGAELVALAYESDITVNAVPGPTAAITAIALSGIDGSKFLFEGFLKGKAGEKKQQLQEVANINRTLVYYEAPHKLLDTLKLMLEVLGNRNISVSREITKLYEETLLFTLEDAIVYYSDARIKGEFVIVVAPAPIAETKSLSQEESVELVLKSELSGMSLSTAAKEVAQLTGHKKNELYKQALERKAEK